MEYYRLTIPIPKQPWLWLRFRIVTVLLLVAVAALVLGWWRDHRQLSMRIYQLQHSNSGWGVDQVLGPPNTTGPGDIRTAWAPATQDGQQEWIVLEYDSAVKPVAILVHETHNPGAVTKVSHFPRLGHEKILWEGTDPTPVGAGAGVSRLPVAANIKTNRIKLYIDSPGVSGWNEIDAVGIECADGDILWAERAKASSSYGSNIAEEAVFFQTGGGVLTR